MAGYATNNELGGTQQNLSSTYKTIIDVFATSGSLRRARVFDFKLGANGTPADNELEWDISRMTADGTGTAVTPNPLDPADVACLASSKANYTAEPTVTSNSSLFYMAANQRASYRWVATPGKELVIPATASNGLVARARSAAYSSTVTADMTFDE